MGEAVKLFFGANPIFWLDLTRCWYLWPLLRHLSRFCALLLFRVVAMAGMANAIFWPMSVKPMIRPTVTTPASQL